MPDTNKAIAVHGLCNFSTSNIVSALLLWLAKRKALLFELTHTIVLFCRWVYDKMSDMHKIGLMSSSRQMHCSNCGWYKDRMSYTNHIREASYWPL